MGRAEVGTPKYLANKMKSKGLQKLRWYCQMCQKQCRDENGFKCHTTSESHQRQLLLFADNSRKYMDSFSSEFSTGYLEILRRQFGTKRVAANKVYQDYIADRNHLHMNATKWLTLSDFVKYLGRQGHCIVDETEKGWFITYIDRDPDTVERQEKMAKKKQMDKDDEERLQEFIEKQVERGRKSDDDEEEEAGTSTKFTGLVRENEEEAIKLDLKLKMKAKPEFAVPSTSAIPTKRLVEFSIDGDDEKIVKRSKTSSSKDTGRRLSALDEIMKVEEQNKEKANRKDFWLAEGIVVKLVAKSLGEKFYKQKGVVVEVIDKYQGKIKLLETGEKIKVDQVLICIFLLYIIFLKKYYL
jgi:DNA/RNA-binding protein KIN17